MKLKIFFRYVTRIALGLLAIVLAAGVVFSILVVSHDLAGERTTPAGYKRATAQYLVMRDGTRIAVDVWLPPDIQDGERIPAMITATRYWRALEPGIGYRAFSFLGLVDRNKIFDRNPFPAILNDEGFAVVKVDARGSGASFGTRPAELSPEEIKDYGEVIDWVVQQSWSNGSVGSYGFSYEGSTAELMASTKHPALKVVVLLYSDFDTHFQLMTPGGGFAPPYSRDWENIVRAMDRNSLDWMSAIQGSGSKADQFMLRLMVRGVKPVDEDNDRALLSGAIKDHAANPDTYEVFSAAEYRDDPMGDSGLTLTDVSPLSWKKEIEASGVPMYVAVGLLDAATADGALSRYLTFDNPQHVVIGPFTHGGANNIDPFIPAGERPKPPMQETLTDIARFAKPFVTGQKTPEQMQPGIRYYMLGDGWHETKSWPLPDVTKKRYWLGPDQSLQARQPPGASGADIYEVDFAVRSGTRTRWNQVEGSNILYDKRREISDRLLIYVTEPFDHDTEIIGTPVINLKLATTHEDGVVFVYLEDVAPDGSVTYITEGVLRLVHRKIAQETPFFAQLGPYHSFRRTDAAPMVPGEIAEIEIGLYTASALIRKGHRLRVSLAGADAAMFQRYPAEGEPVWTVYRNVENTSFIDLPLRSRE